MSFTFIRSKSRLFFFSTEIFACLVQVSGSEKGKRRRPGGQRKREIPAEEGRMDDGWIARQGEEGGREGGKLDRGEGKQDEDKE